MADLTHRQGKIQQKRKQTSWREFVREICSWYPFVLYNRNALISVYPDTERSCPIIPHKAFLEEIDTLKKYGREYDV
jgi:hypothetical protein